MRLCASWWWPRTWRWPTRRRPRRGNQAERSRALRIRALENNFNLVATLPADVFLSDRLAQLQPDLIIVDAEAKPAMRWNMW